MIYLITCKETMTCKIGYSLKPESRLVQLQTGSPYPLELTAIKEGSIKDEKLLHEHFKDYSLMGEWFDLNEKILEYFNADVEKDFVKLYFENIADFYKLSSSCYLVFLVLSEKMNKNNTLRIDIKVKKDVSVKLKCSIKLIEKCVNELHNQNFIVRIERSVYILNPKYVCKSKWENVKDILKYNNENENSTDTIN